MYLLYDVFVFPRYSRFSFVFQVYLFLPSLHLSSFFLFGTVATSAPSLDGVVASFDGRSTVRVLGGAVSTLRHRCFGPPLSDHLQCFTMPHLVIVLKVSPEHWRSRAAIMDVWNNCTRLSFGSRASPPGRMPGRVVCLCVCLSWFPPPRRAI